MPPVIPDAPWWANLALLMTGVVGVLLVGTVPAWLAFRATRGGQEEIKRTVSVVRDQVANSHGTNLRDDLDKVLAAVGAVQDGQRRHDVEIARLYDTTRDAQRAVTEGMERLADADAEDRRRADHEHARIWRALTPTPSEES